MNYSLKNRDAAIEIFRDLSIFCVANNEVEKQSIMPSLLLTNADFFEEQFKLHYSYLCSVAYSMVDDENAARDIVQNFFLYCWNKRQQINITYTFKSYAVRSVRNASLNYLKKYNRNKFETLQNIEKSYNDNSVEKEEMDEYRNKALWTAVSRLPEQRKKIFLLSNIEGLKYQEIADRLDISINTVKTQIKLALRFLRGECDWMNKTIIFIIVIKYSVYITHFTHFIA